MSLHEESNTLSCSKTSKPQPVQTRSTFPAYLNQTLYAKLVSDQQLDLRLPTSWNAKDKSKNIEVKHDGLGLSYIGPGKQENHAALARSNYPMRPQCGIFYYEMKVISKGDDGYIGIGFCGATNKLERLPGWDPESWGYHGDDGHSFAGSGSGKTYGPCFTTGDVIGCGVNFADCSAFYTKNGKFLGTAFTGIDLTKPIFPAVGLRTPGEEITTNFGYDPFVFDIEHYIMDQKMKYIKEITVSQEPQLNKDMMDQLISSYLIHHGYTHTAKAVLQNAGHRFQTDSTFDRDMEERQFIRSAILQGRFDEAIHLINIHFPGLLQEEERGQSLHLWLKQSTFIEFMRDYCNKAEHVQLQRAMQYGKHLREEYRHDTQEKTRTSLVEIFSLLAYPDPYTSPVAYLMDTARRDVLATEVNAAILAYQHCPEVPALERMYIQTILCNEELSRKGDGKATLINIENYCKEDHFFAV